MLNHCAHVAAFYRHKAETAQAPHVVRFYRAACVGFLILCTVGLARYRVGVAS